LDEVKLDQEQYLIEGYEEKEDKNKIDGDEEDDEIVLKKDGETPDGDNKVDDKKKNLINPINDGKTKEQMDEDDILYEENTAKMINKIVKWKNMDISDQIDLTCSNKDKEREREIIKKIRLRFKKQRKTLRAKDHNTPDEVNTLIDLDAKIRDLSKPLMNEDIFFGFDDISDEYDYGREIFKEDIYEYHPNMVIPYKKICFVLYSWNI